MLITAKSRMRNNLNNTDKLKVQTKDIAFGNHTFSPLPKMNDIPDPKKDKLRLHVEKQRKKIASVAKKYDKTLLELQKSIDLLTAYG